VGRCCPLPVSALTLTAVGKASEEGSAENQKGRDHLNVLDGAKNLFIDQRVLGLCAKQAESSVTNITPQFSSITVTIGGYSMRQSHIQIDANCIF